MGDKITELKRGSKRVERTSSLGKTSHSTLIYCYCSECNEQIFMPSDNIVQYNYCYHCGSKFKIPVTREEFIRVKHN